MNHSIVVKNLFKQYGDLVAVKDVSFEVNKGEVFGLLGENGAGKTTTLEIVEGLRTATSGSVEVLGHDIATDQAAIKEKIGVQLQSSAYYAFLTLREILNLFATFYGRAINADELLESVALSEKANSYVTQLSGGQKQRFSIVASLVNDPEVVFLDEPTTGLDPFARRNLWELIVDIKKRGKTVILTTHYLEEAEILCDRVAIMNRGEIIAMDKTNQLVERAKYPYRLIFEPTKNAREAQAKLEKIGTVQEDPQKQTNVEVLLSSQSHLNDALDIVRTTAPIGLVVRPASLEDVFIELTGKRLHIEEEHA